uniref:AGC-kinase C-terminal domain-containing protein n=1 Tax=Strongyloides papillosus TaxID=174720 RepID=A0A0N5B7M7_STREA
MNQATEKRSRSSGCKSLERPNTGDSQFPCFKQPSIPKFIPNKKYFTLEDSNVDDSFGFPGIGDDSMRDIRHNKPQQRFRPISTSTQRRADIIPAISQDTSPISEVPYFDSLKH